MHLQDLQFLILLFSNLYIVYLIITSYTPSTAKHFLRTFGFGKHSKNLATAAFCCVFTNVFVNSAPIHTDLSNFQDEKQDISNAMAL